MAQRVQKFLSSIGHGSRREIENWINNGRLFIDNLQAEIGQPVTGKEKFHLDGKLLKVTNSHYSHNVLSYNKPIDEITTRFDPEGRRTVFQSLPDIPGSRWISIGRLDINTSGLLLFTTDGKLANALMHPAQMVERRYSVRVQGKPSKAEINLLCRGIKLSDGKAQFNSIKLIRRTTSNSWLHVSLREGRNREVRRLWEAIGYRVGKLKRIGFGSIDLSRSIKPGNYKILNESETKLLYLDAHLKI